MAIVRFQQQTPEFRGLVSQAASAAAGGKVSPEALGSIEACALSNGSLSAQEALLVQALREGRPDTLKALCFIDPKAESFELEIKKNPLPETSSSADISAPLSTNPLGARIRDRGEEVYGQAVGVSSKFGGAKRLREAIAAELSRQPALKPSVERLLSALPKADDPEALAYLKTLLTGREPALSPEAKLQLIDKLGAMARSDYDHRLGPNRNLIVSALHDIALPSDICQHRVGTCAGTCAQIKLAAEQPGEYLNMLDKLASHQPYKALSGKDITPNWSFADEKGWQKSGRTPSSSLIQNAIMDFADGERRAYASSSKDKNLTGGLYLDEAERIFEALFNQNFQGENCAWFGIQDAAEAQKLIDKLVEAKPSRQNNLYLSMRFDAPGTRDAFHAVLLTGINGDKATLLNPWGREETVKLDVIKSRLMGALLPAGELKPPAPAAPPDPDAEKKYLEELTRKAREHSGK